MALYVKLAVETKSYMDAKTKGAAVADACRVLLKFYNQLPGQEDFKEVGKEDFFELTDHSTIVLL